MLAKASKIPVTLLIVNRKMNPKTHKMLPLRGIWSIISEKIHVKIFTLVGTLIIKLAAVKYIRVSISILTVNIWCAHTIHLKNLIDKIDQLILKYLNLVLLPV